MSKVLDIKQRQWGIGGDADTPEALHVYGDVISSNITSLTTNLTNLESLCQGYIDNFTTATATTGSKAANSTSWVYSGISATLDARDLIIYGSGWAGSACKGLRFSSSSTSSSAGSTTEAYSTAESSGPATCCPVALFIGNNGSTRYLWTLRAEAKTTTDSFRIQKIGHFFAP